jgi:HSP20 family protein
MEPLVDVFDEADFILVVAEVPGAEEDSIRVELENHTLKLRAGGKHRAYRGEVGLPAEVRLNRKKRKRRVARSRSAGGH